MASPLLEAGAIDGARGILINITGSSSLKLSEVNEASSLIQSAAHEDANIIFGAVLDEQMGDDVKITVIATGFRDQMPERRARMLSIGEVVMPPEPIGSVPVVSTQVTSVPVVAGSTWMNEPKPSQAAIAAAVAPFLSDADEMDAEESDGDYFFGSSSASAANTAVSAPIPVVAKVPEPEFDPEFDSEFAAREAVMAASRPQFAEMAEEPSYTPLPRDYASDFGSGVRPAAETEEHRAQPAPALFGEADEETHRDLDTPTFMRRMRF
jgi:cell division protein FtsZ